MKTSALPKLSLGVVSLFFFAATINSATVVASSSSENIHRSRIDVQEDDEDSIEKSREKIRKFFVELKRLDYLSQLSSEIDNLSELIGLDESQTKKLSVAAKAVVRDRTNKWTKQMDEYEAWIDVLDFVNVDELKEFENLDEAKFRDVPAKMLQWINDEESFGVVDVDLFKNKRWLTALNAVANDEQKKKLEQVFAERQEAASDALYDYLAQTLAQKLVLNDGKKTALRQFIEAEIDKRPIKSEVLAMTADIMDLSMSRLAAADLEEVEKFLSQSQVNRWRTLMASYGPDGFMFTEDSDLELELIEESDDDLESEMDDQ